ncbi:cation/acetate symporter ActP [Paremcibacter congregatus]|uniref:Cation/acetate symporter ActP n=1 Tax=Paremcibacter congregatus TaxID=2043170 RepID=A0A2G4YQT7_9PROT|nr:cation acetate symporter [Paremcibacter congregatus]QDE29320.1 sodium/solute symporter [Paremcibacter congregatus]
MKKFLSVLCLSVLTSTAAFGAGADISGAVEKQPLNMTAIFMFFIFVLATLGITWWAARNTKSKDDFYAAGGGIKPWQNGTAIAGDFMSAATFLGITGAIYGFGFDALILAVGVMAAWPVILFLIAERLRNLGSYTFIDVVSYRLEKKPIRIISAIGSLSVVIFYLIAQMVGAGKLIQLLFGLDYVYAVILVSFLMMCYVSFGGMLATTWVQLIKAILLLIGGTFIAFMVMKSFAFDFGALLASASSQHPKGAAIMAPGLWLKDPVAIISIALTMMFGIMGLPHILMRFFTVKDAKDARKSVFYATSIMGYFYILIIIIGYGAVTFVMGNPDYHDELGKILGGGNMVALHLTHYMGGNLMLGFMSAVAFATILAVVAGLTLAGAATISHDLYAKTFRKTVVTNAEEIKVSRIATFGLGGIAVLLGIAFEHQNVAFVASLALAIAASVNFPILIVSMYWSKMTTRGAVAGGVVGLALSIGLIVLGPSVWVAVLGNDSPIYPYVYPTFYSMPLAFVAIWLVSVLDKSPRAAAERAKFDEQYVRSETGIGISAASDH